MRVVVVLGLVYFLLAQPAVSQVPDDKLIVPGQRIGKWTLEMTVDDLVRMNGLYIRQLWSAGGSRAADLARDVVVLIWGTVYADTVDEKSVVGLGIWSRAGDAYRTAEGVGRQSTHVQVRKAYGEPTAETKPRPGEIRLIYDKIGIMFWFDPNALVRVMSVFPPGTAKSSWKY